MVRVQIGQIRGWKLINEKIQNFVLFFKNLLSCTKPFKTCKSGRYFGFGYTCFIDCGSMRFVFESSFIPASREPFRAVPHRTNIVMLTVLFSIKLHEIVQFICTKCTRKNHRMYVLLVSYAYNHQDTLKIRKLRCYYDLLSCVHHLNDCLFNIVVCV